ncbi:MAG: CHAT domain-containing protein [Rhizomicrobium sp.]|jgi:hypothetical protein
MPLQNALDITLLGARGGKPAFVAARLGDEVAFSELPTDNTIAELLKTRDNIEESFYGRVTVSSKELERYGEKLGQVLLGGDVHELYSSARRKGVRINLITNDSELRRLPWEFFHGHNDLPGPEVNRALVRIISSGQESMGALPVPPEKLKVLLLVSRAPDDKIVPLDRFTKAMEDRFRLRLKGKVELEVRAVGTQVAISSALRERDEPWDVVHFLGHGEIRDIENEAVGGIVLSGAGEDRFLPASKLGALFAGRLPRLLVLSACATGQTDVKARFSNTASVLLQRNIPAVVANQMVITADSIAEFSTELYSKLLECGDIDEAVLAGRIQSFATLVADKDETARVEWGIPVLYRHFGAQRLFAGSAK